jgi:hypothetical protein
MTFFVEYSTDDRHYETKTFKTEQEVEEFLNGKAYIFSVIEGKPAKFKLVEPYDVVVDANGCTWPQYRYKRAS